MKIAYVLDTFPCLTETFVLREMLALRERGIETIPYALRAPERPVVGDDAQAFAADMRYASALRGQGTDIPLPQRLAVFARIVVRLTRDVPGALRLLRAFPVAVVLAGAVRQDGIGHTHAHFATVPADVGLLVAWLARTPFSFSAHARDVYVRPGAALRWKIRQASFVAVCSEHARQRLLSLAPETPPEKIRLIRHGVAPEDFGADSSKPGAALAVGRLVAKKGFSTLVDACRLLKERGTVIPVAVVGAGPEAGALAERTRRLGLEGDVTWLGEQPYEVVSQWRARARMLVLPSVEAPDGDRDGVANVLLEAMAAGVPVIASTASAAPEAVDDGAQGFLVPPEDPVALADRMERIWADCGLAERMGRAGRERVAERFDIAKNIAPLAQAFLDSGKESGHG